MNKDDFCGGITAELQNVGPEDGGVYCRLH